MTSTRTVRLAVTLFALAACATAPPEKTPAPILNLRRVSEHVWSSGRPEGRAAFERIAALGVKTVICVDGEVPDIESAREAGLHYVHLPLNYSGISEQRALELAKAARELEGPFLVHCHKGTIRGPAAAAIVRLAVDGGTAEEAVAEMRSAGTDPHYKGLFASVERFDRSRDTRSIACNFAEVSQRPPLVDTMTDLQLRTERLRANKALEGDPAHEALIVREAFEEELRRKPRSDLWHERLLAARDAARTVEESARGDRPLAPALEGLQRACTACHAVFRDR